MHSYSNTMLAQQTRCSGPRLTPRWSLPGPRHLQSVPDFGIGSEEVVRGHGGVGAHTAVLEQGHEHCGGAGQHPEGLRPRRLTQDSRARVLDAVIRDPPPALSLGRATLQLPTCPMGLPHEASDLPVQGSQWGKVSSPQTQPGSPMRGWSQIETSRRP